LKLASTTKTKFPKVRDEPINYWHGKLGIYPLSYRSTPVEWQTECFIRTASCEAVWSNKFWNRKIHGT